VPMSSGSPMTWRGNLRDHIGTRRRGYHRLHRYAYVRFKILPRGMAVSNHRYLSRSETGANAGVRRWKLHPSESTWFQESNKGICFIIEWRAASLRPSLGFCNFKPPLKRSIIKCIFWLNGSYFKFSAKILARSLHFNQEFGIRIA
jgi:hypothetical protein